MIGGTGASRWDVGQKSVALGNGQGGLMGGMVSGDLGCSAEEGD